MRVSSPVSCVASRVITSSGRVDWALALLCRDALFAEKELLRRATREMVELRGVPNKELRFRPEVLFGVSLFCFVHTF